MAHLWGTSDGSEDPRGDDLDCNAASQRALHPSEDAVLDAISLIGGTILGTRYLHTIPLLLRKAWK
jgi:hypothetical protein